MNYGQLKFVDMLDGPGLRVTLFVSGCSNNCPGCHNPETHDPNFGQPFTEETMNEILSELKLPHYSGFTFCGGDPLFKSNRQSVLDISKRIKSALPNKTIWMYTGYTLEEIQSWNDETVNSILSYVDVLLEGRYIESLRSPDKHWAGSSNQRAFEIHHSDNINTFTEINI